MRQKEKATTVLFLRHGQTDFPLDRIYCDDREDPELNEAGKQQAENAARLLHQEPVAAIFSSPTCRTRMTAAPVARLFGLDVQILPGLEERRFGVWEGLYFHEIERDYPDEYLNWKRDNAGFRPEGGESIPDLMIRLRASISNVITKHLGQTVLVVTHVGPVRALVAEAIGLPLSYYRRLTVDNASVTRVDYGKSQNNLRYLNRFS